MKTEKIIKMMDHETINKIIDKYNNKILSLIDRKLELEREAMIIRANSRKFDNSDMELSQVKNKIEELERIFNEIRSDREDFIHEVKSTGMNIASLNSPIK